MPQAFEILRGTAVIAASSASATITESTDYTLPAGATANNCFIRITNTRQTGMGNNAAGGSQNDDDTTVRISNPSNILTSINFTRVGTANSCHVSYEIWCYVGDGGGANEIIVRDVGVVSGTAAQLTGTTITTIADNADCVVFITGQGSSSTGRADAHYRLWTASLVANVSDWDPQFDRDSVATAATGHVSYAVVEFVGSNWTIDRVESTTTGTAWAAANNNSFTIAHGVTIPTLAKAGIIESQYSTSNDATGLDDAGDASYLDSTSNIRVWNRVTTGTRRKVWWIAQNSQADGTARNLNVQHIEFRDDTTSGAEPRGWTEVISTGPDSGTGAAVAVLDETSLVGTASVDGGGTAFPRGAIDYRLTGLDEITFRESDNGQERRICFEIWEWPEDPAAGTSPIAGTSAAVFGESASLTGTGTLAGTSAAVFGESASLTGTGTLAGTVAFTFGESAALTGTGTLAGTSAAVFGESAALTGTGTLAGTSAAVFGESASLKATGKLLGTINVTFGESASLTDSAAPASGHPVAKLIRLGNYGGPRQLYGSFGSKTPDIPSGHPVVKLIRLGSYGGPRQLYGSFTGKTPDVPSAHPVAKLIRLGMYGGPRQLYGDFSSKTPSTPTVAPETHGVTRPPDRARMLLNRPRSPAPRLFRRR